MHMMTSKLRKTFRQVFTLPVAALAGIALLSGCAGELKQIGTAIETRILKRGEVDFEKPYGDYLAGRYAKARRDSASAADFYATALAKDPDNVPLMRRTFLLMLVEGRMERALDLGSQIYEKSPRDREVPLLLALHRMKKSEYAAARRLLTGVPDSGLNGFLLPVVRAWIAVGEGDIQGALGQLEPLNSSKAHTNLQAFHRGLINDFAGNWDAARSAYQKAMAESSGRSVQVLNAYGSFLSRTDNSLEGRAVMEKFLAAVPNNYQIRDILTRLESGEKLPQPAVSPMDGVAEVMYSAGTALARENARDAATIYLQLALFARPDFPLAQTLLAELREADRRWADAIRIYRSIKPGSAFSHNANIGIASNLNRMGETDQALSLLQRIAERNPKDAEALITQGDILRSKERFVEAAEAYGKAIERYPSFHEADWSLFYVRGIANERSAQWDAAEKDFLKALELKPEQPLVMNYLGYSWIEKGRNFDRARGMIERAVELRPNDGYIVDSLGWVLYRLGDFDEAVTQLERAVELRPQDPVINDHLGDALWRVGRRFEARFQWRRALSLEPEETLIPTIEQKLKVGLAASDESGGKPKNNGG